MSLERLVHKVTFIMVDGETRQLKIPTSLLQELVVKLSDGPEWVHTSKGSYEVVGMIVGPVKPMVIITEEEDR